MSLDNSIGRLDGAILFVGICGYTLWLIRASRRGESPEVVDEYATAIDVVEGDGLGRSLPVQVGSVLAGLGVLVLGSQLLVESATDIATEFGVSELVIGLTVVAIGTSLPELATSMMAAIRGQRDIAVGNIVGSCLFNLLCVLGATGVVSPDGVNVTDASLRLDLPVMLAATIVLVPIFWNGFEIKRWEGFVLVFFYVAYVVYLVLSANDSEAADVMRPAALITVPLVLMTFGVTGFQSWRRHRTSA